MEQSIFGGVDGVAHWGRIAFLWLVPVLLWWRLLDRNERSLQAWRIALGIVDAVLLIAALCALAVILLPVILGLASGEEYEQRLVLERMTGPYEWAFWPMVCCLLLPFLLLDRGMRRSWRIPFLLCLFFALLPLLVEALTWVIKDTVPAAWSEFPTLAQVTLIWVLLSVPVAAMLRTRERRLVERGM